MQILVLLGMYFDAVVVFVTSQTHLFRLALAILCWDRFFFSLISATELKLSKVKSLRNVILHMFY